MDMVVDMLSIQLNNRCRTLITITNIQMLKMEIISKHSINLVKLKVVSLVIRMETQWVTNSHMIKLFKAIHLIKINKHKILILIGLLVEYSNKINS